MIHCELREDEGILIVRPEGPLQAEDFQRMSREVDPYILRQGRLKGIMIHTESFPGWDDFAGLLGHLRFVRDHHRKVEKIAAVTDSAFLSIAPSIARHFVSAQVKRFPFEEREAAMDWLRDDRMARQDDNPGRQPRADRARHAGLPEDEEVRHRRAAKGLRAGLSATGPQPRQGLVMSPSASYRIRRLAPDDVALMHALLTMFGEAFGEVETYGSARPRKDYLERLLGGDSFIALAALKGDEVVGGIAAYELHKFERERSEVYIYDLAVAAAHRREGIATAMILELKRIAAARGAWVIFVQADLGDGPAIALYSKLGAREDVLHFDMPIGKDADGRQDDA